MAYVRIKKTGVNQGETSKYANETDYIYHTTDYVVCDIFELVLFDDETLENFELTLKDCSEVSSKYYDDYQDDIVDTISYSNVRDAFYNLLSEFEKEIDSEFTSEEDEEFLEKLRDDVIEKQGNYINFCAEKEVEGLTKAIYEHFTDLRG